MKKKKELTKEKIKCYKITEREIFKKFTKLSEDKLIAKINKKGFVNNTIMTKIIKHCRGEKKRGIKAIDGFRKKLYIPDYEISESIEHKVKSKIGRIFVNEDILDEYSVKICKTDPYFSRHYEKKNAS